MSSKELAFRIRRLKDDSTAFTDTLYAAASAVYCALLSNILFLGEFAPLGIAAAAVKNKRGLFAVLGSILGYVAVFTPNSAVYCGALLAATGVSRMLWHKNKRLADKATPYITGISLAVCYMPKLFAEGVTWYAVGALICQVAALSVFSSFLSRTDSVLTLKNRPMQSENESVIMCVVISLGVCGLIALWPAAFNPIRALIVGITVWTGLYGGVACGASMGVTGGTVIALMTGNVYYLLPLALGGIISGLAQNRGKAAAVTGMLISCALSLAICKADDVTLMFTLELLIGSALLLIIPDAFLAHLGSSVFIKRGDSSFDRRAALGLYNAGKGLSEAAECITAVSDRLRTVNAGDPAWVFNSASATVCTRCGLKNVCWIQNYSETIDSLNSLTPVLNRFGRVSREDMPASFAADCPRSAEMAAAVNRFYGEFALKRSTNDYAFQMRGMLAKQFKGLADIIVELSEDLSGNGGCDRAASRRAYDVFSAEFLRTDECVCLLDRRRRMTLEVTGDSECMNVDMDKLVSRLEDALGRRLCRPQMIPIPGGDVKLVFHEKTEYRLETAAASLAANGEKVSGDQKCVFNHDGYGICIVSDGMGSGSLASVESKMTVTLLHRLICAGFSYESALSVVNWSLMVKGNEERLATADMLSVDLYTGNAALIKAGAPPTFVRHKKEVREVSFPSVPVGILTQTEQDSRSFRLSHGDIVVMVSDGALYGDNSWLIRELSSSGDDIAKLADSLLQRAKARRPSNEDDDITVLCARLVKTD